MVMSLTIIKPFDVIEDVGSGLFSGEIPLAIDPFTFEQGEEAFHRRVIETIPFRTQRSVEPHVDAAMIEKRGWCIGFRGRSDRATRAEDGAVVGPSQMPGWPRW